MLTSIYTRKGRKGVTLEYEDPVTGKWRQKSFRALDGVSAKERAQEAAAALREAARKAPTVESVITFSDYAARWLRATKTAVRPGTYRNYEANIRVHLEPAFRGKLLRDITRADVRDLIVSLREAGRKKKSVANIRGTLHAILEAAGPDEERLISSNPAHYRSKSKLLRLATSAGELRAKVKAFDVDQARDFFAAAPASAPLHHMLWRTMVATGLRPGEGQGLQPGDLDYKGSRIRIERAITRGQVQACKTTEQGEFEYVDMPRSLAAELKAWETAQAAAALASGRPRSEWLFPSSTGGFVDEKGAADAFKRVLKKAGLPGHFSQHSLRHTYATQQLIHGESIYYVMRQLRHADIKITVKTYGSWLPAGNSAAAERHYERLFGGAGSDNVRKNSRKGRHGR
jgi:integrase